MSQELKEAKKLLSLAAFVEGKPSFLTKLAQGKFDEDLLASFELEDISKNKFNKLWVWLNDYLNNQVDPIQILRNSKVPKDVLAKLSQLLLGAKIKKQYGGLELSTLQYCLLMRILSSHSAALGIWYTANCSIGLSGYLMVVYDSLKKELKETKDPAKTKEVEELITKTEWQMKEFLPKLAAGANAGFGLTQVEAGSDPMAMIGTGTVAERTKDGMFHVRGHKLYNTNGTIAEFEVIMAPLASIGGSAFVPRNSICSFIVPTSGYGKFQAIPLEFIGNRGIDNALIFFEVKIPESFLIGRESGHDGFKNALRTLNVGRLAMAAGSSATIANCLQISRWWSKVRVQQGRPIGKYKVNGIRVAKMACDAFAVEAIMNLGSAMYDKYKLDVDLRLETAAIKLWSTERAVAAARTNQDIRSGAGYETYDSQARRAKLVEPHTIPIPDETFTDDANILKIGEGTSDIQRMIISGMLFAPHAFRLLPIMDIKNPLKAVKATITALVYYSLWIPARLSTIFVNGFILLFKNNHSLYIKHASSKLALKSFWLMVRYKSKLLREQVVTAFIADQLTELWVMSAVSWYAGKLYPKCGNIVNEIADVHCSYARCRINGDSDSKPQPSTDDKAYKLGQKIIFEDAAEFLEKDVVTILDRELKRWGGVNKRSLKTR